MLTKRRRRQIAKLFFTEMGDILRERGVENPDVTDKFSREEAVEAFARAGIPDIERDEFLADLDATHGHTH